MAEADGGVSQAAAALAKQLSVDEAVVERIFRAGIDHGERARKRRCLWAPTPSQDGAKDTSAASPPDATAAADGEANQAGALPSSEVLPPPSGFHFSPGVTLEALRAELAEFALERDWDQFHSPRNLALAMVGEVGELCECFQWKGEVAEGLPGFKEKERTHIGQELADVLLYLLRLSHKCRVDLAKAALDKLAVNAAKYPASLVRGSSRKYSEYTVSPSEPQR
mmetsp:Transcript_54247/g.108923  ORF Transcript_54247/g.108923 Transcript_54247/m.108923 type:complete len:224 (-) Transcript_54247:126-797(-)